MSEQPAAKLQVLLVNDTREAGLTHLAHLAHLGCYAAVAAIEAWLAQGGASVAQRVPVHALRGAWRGTIGATIDALQTEPHSQARVQGWLQGVHCAVLNAEGSVHDGAGLELLALLALAQRQGLPTAVLNASFENLQDSDEGYAVLARAQLVHAREPRTARELALRGIAHVLAPDAIVDAPFAHATGGASVASHHPIALPSMPTSQDLPRLPPGAVVCTDAHESRRAAMERATSIARDAFGERCVVLPLENPAWRTQWQHAPQLLHEAACVVTARHHGVYAALLAGVPVVALQANTSKLHATHEMLTAGLESCGFELVHDDADIVAAVQRAMQARGTPAFAAMRARLDASTVQSAVQAWTASIPRRVVRPEPAGEAALHVMMTSDQRAEWTRAIVRVVGRAPVRVVADGSACERTARELASSLGALGLGEVLRSDASPARHALVIVAEQASDAASAFAASADSTTSEAIVLCCQPTGASQPWLAAELCCAGEHWIRHPRLDQVVTFSQMASRQPVVAGAWCAWAFMRAASEGTLLSESASTKPSATPSAMPSASQSTTQGTNMGDAPQHAEALPHVLSPVLPLAPGSNPAPFALACKALDALRVRGTLRVLAASTAQHACAEQWALLARHRVPAMPLPVEIVLVHAAHHKSQAAAGVVALPGVSASELSHALQPAGRAIVVVPRSAGWQNAWHASSQCASLLAERVVGVSDDGRVLDAPLVQGPAGPRLDGEMLAASHWALLCTQDPVGASAAGYADAAPAAVLREAGHNVLRFATDYANPWLVRGLVSVDERTQTPHVLRSIAERALAVARAGVLAEGPQSKHATDVGACLCVLAYSALQRELVGSAPDAGSLCEQLHEFAGAASASSRPHVLRWRISCLFVLGLLREAMGEAEAACAAWRACAELEPRPFSPLLGTKTLESMLKLGEHAMRAGDSDVARGWWLRGVQTARQLMQGDWLNITGPLDASDSEPLAFGVREAAEVLHLGARCSLQLRELPRAAATPGLAHALAQAETFADVHAEAMRVWKRAQSLASELHASQASYAAERERLQQWVSRLEGERGWREEQAKGWMEKVAQLERALAQQAAWGDALRTDLSWAREQNERWEARVGELEGVVRERDAWMQTLRADGEWHKSQALAWQRKVDEAESVARDASTFAQTLQTQLAQMQREKDWLADHREKVEAQLRLLRGEQPVEVSPPPSS